MPTNQLTLYCIDEVTIIAKAHAIQFGIVIDETLLKTVIVRVVVIEVRIFSFTERDETLRISVNVRVVVNEVIFIFTVLVLAIAEGHFFSCAEN